MFVADSLYMGNSRKPCLMPSPAYAGFLFGVCVRVPIFERRVNQSVVKGFIVSPYHQPSALTRVPCGEAG
jgi:hypothetical protein